MKLSVQRVSLTAVLTLALACVSCSFSKEDEPQVQSAKPAPGPSPSPSPGPLPLPSSSPQTAKALPPSANAPQAVAGFAVAPPFPAPPADAQRPDRILRSGHSDEIAAITFSPDGRWIASGSADKTIRIWDVSTGRTLRVLLGHTDVIWSLAFSPDGKRLASASQDATVRVWDTSSWTALNTISSVTNIPIRCLYSADGKFLIVSNESKEEEGGGASIDIRNAVSNELIRTIPLEWGVAQPLVATREGHLLSSGGAGEDADIEVATNTWDLITGRQFSSVPIFALALSSDGRWTASRVNEQDATKILIHDARSGKLARSIVSPDRAVGYLEFSPDSSRLIAALGPGPVSGMGSRIQSWDVATGKELSALPGEKNASLRAMAFSPDGKLLAAGGYQGNAIRIWDLATAQVVRALDGNPSSGFVAFDPHGQLVVSEPNGLRTWNLATGEEITSVHGVGGGSVVFSPDGEWLASNPQGSPKLWKTNVWTPVDLSPSAVGYIWSLAFTPTQLSAPLADSGIKSWQAATADGPGPSLLGFTYAMAVSPDKKLLAVGHARGGDVDVWDLSTATKITSFAATQVSINRLEFSPDGKLLLTAGQETPISPAMIAAHQFNFQSAAKLWDVATWTTRASISLSGMGVGVGEFSPDSRLLAFNRSGLIEIFEIASNKLVRRLVSGEYPTGNMAFSPDGAWLASFTQHGVYAWKLDAGGPNDQGKQGN